MDWHALVKAGVVIEASATEFAVTTRSHEPTVQVSPTDVIAGMRAHREDSAALAFWAKCLLTVELFDFETLSRHRGGDAFIESIWDVSFGKVPSKREIDRLEKQSR
jgi:hypothetical protein